MTGPEHYREAEQLLRSAAYDTADAAVDCRDAERDADFLRAAQVHATLALTAATALQPSAHRPESTTWADVASFEDARREGDR